MKLPNGVFVPRDPRSSHTTTESRSLRTDQQCCGVFPINLLPQRDCNIPALAGFWVYIAKLQMTSGMIYRLVPISVRAATSSLDEYGVGTAIRRTRVRQVPVAHPESSLDQALNHTNQHL